MWSQGEAAAAARAKAAAGRAWQVWVKSLSACLERRVQGSNEAQGGRQASPGGTSLMSPEGALSESTRGSWKGLNKPRLAGKCASESPLLVAGRVEGTGRRLV